jgi:hypothetical protein
MLTGECDFLGPSRKTYAMLPRRGIFRVPVPSCKEEPVILEI